MSLQVGTYRQICTSAGLLAGVKEVLYHKVMVS